MKKILKYLLLLKSPEEFTFEQRIFNNSCLIAIAECLISILVNWFLNIGIIATVINILSLILFLLIFILFRFKNMQLTFLFLITAIMTVVAMWFVNGGSYGSVQYYFTIVLASSVILLRGKKRDFMTFINISIIIILMLFEYNYPKMIIGYDSQFYRYIDTITGISISVFFLAIIMKMVINNFDLEREKVKQETLELDKINKLLQIKNREISKRTVLL